MSVGCSATAAAVRELSCEDHCCFLATDEICRLFEIIMKYLVLTLHRPTAAHRLYLLLLSGAQNKEGKMLKTVWTFLGMLCTLSIVGLFLGSSHNSSPPCFFHIICQYLYNKNLDSSIILCAVIFPHLVAGVCQTCSE